MKNNFLFFTLLLICTSTSAQNDDGFIKGENNIEYKIFPSASGNAVQYGNYVKMHIIQMYRGTKDTVLYDSQNFASPIQPIDTFGASGLPIYYYNILKQLKNNDSVAMRVVADSAFKNTGMPMPQMFEPGKYIYTCIKIEDIYDTKAKADEETIKLQMQLAEANAKKDAELFVQQNAVLSNYFATNNITDIIKAPLGTYIKILKKGVGRNVNDSDQVKVNYTGKTFGGKLFDSNIDPQFGHVTPLNVDMTKRTALIMGWLEGLTYLNKGAKAILYIPSPIAFGANGTGDGRIGPNEILIFDIELLEITSAKSKPILPKTKKITTSKPKPKAKKK
jgi:FKBP-type peptidyl-prolyl cis-trans isomerase FkpA